MVLASLLCFPCFRFLVLDAWFWIASLGFVVWGSLFWIPVVGFQILTFPACSHKIIYIYIYIYYVFDLESIEGIESCLSEKIEIQAYWTVLHDMRQQLSSNGQS